ncbi:hypothetical protein SEUCBS139899_010586 [Sporothrix eucalyptigena]
MGFLDKGADDDDLFGSLHNYLKYCAVIGVINEFHGTLSRIMNMLPATGIIRMALFTMGRIDEGEQKRKAKVHKSLAKLRNEIDEKLSELGVDQIPFKDTQSMPYFQALFGADADEFRPERWLDQDKEKLSLMESYWLPFGAGSRTCIGKNISLLEINKLIPVLVKKFDFSLAKDCKKVFIQDKPVKPATSGLQSKSRDLVTRHERTLHPTPEQAGAQVVDARGPKVKEQISAACQQPSQRLTALETPPSDSGQVGDGADGDDNAFDDTRNNPLDDHDGVTIDLADRSTSLMLQSGAGGRMPDQENTDSLNASRDAGSVASIATGDTATRQSFRTYSGQTDNLSLVELDMDILFNVNIDSPITSTEDASVNEAAGGDTGPKAAERTPKEFFLDYQRHHRLQQQHQQQHQQQQAGSMRQEQMPSSPPVAAADGRRPATQQTPLPLSSYMDLDLSGFMYSPEPSGQITAFSPGEEPRSLLHDLGQFHLPNPLSMGLEPLSELVFPTVLQSATPQLALDASRGHYDATENTFDEGRKASASQNTAFTETPVLIRDGRRSFPSFAIHGNIYASLKGDLSRRLGMEYLGDSEIPSSRMCADFLASYVSNFHGHLPIIHLPTFSPGTQPSPLVLIMCSIGALYRLDRKRARRLYETSRKAIDNSDLSTASNQPSLVKGYPLWCVQTRVLLTFYAIMSGDTDLTMAVMRENGVYTIVYHEARISLQDHQRDATLLGWQSWVTIESWKRLLGAILICSTLIMVVYNQNPGMNSTMDLEFDALEDEKLWSAQSSTEWHELYTRGGHDSKAASKQQQPPRTMKGILTDIMIHPQPSKPLPVYEVSAFSGFVLMHAIVVHMWQRAQVLQALAGNAPGPSPTEEALGDILMCSGLQTLARCQAFLDSARNEIGSATDADQGGGCMGAIGNGVGGGSGGPGRARPAGRFGGVRTDMMMTDEEDVEKEASLVFNSNAILRIAHARLFKADSTHNSIDLTNLHGKRTGSSIHVFVNSKMERGTFVLKAVEKAFEGLREPVRIGHLLVRKTAAFRWSVEQAVAGWDCALLVSKFVHAIEMDVLDQKEPTFEEREFCEKVKDVLREAESDVEDGSSLAAAVAKTWSWFLRDVWIWGITPVMGEALDQVGEAYKHALASKTQMAM